LTTRSQILPANKARQLMTGVFTTQGREEKIITLEQQSVIMTVHVSALDTDAVLNIDVFEIGDKDTDQALLYSFPSIRSSQDTPLQIRLSPGGSLLIKVDHSAGVTYDIRGKSVEFLAAPEEITVTANHGELIFREVMLEHLHNINATLDKILNHQRQITDLESDKGDEF
jgi:hypothetical protein